MPANRHTTLAYLVSLPGLLLVCSLLLVSQITLASTRLSDSSAAQDLYGLVDFLADPQSALPGRRSRCRCPFPALVEPP